MHLYSKNRSTYLKCRYSGLNQKHSETTTTTLKLTYIHPKEEKRKF